jgi:putative ABC transport system permease protein
MEQVDGVSAVSRVRFQSSRVMGESSNTSLTGIDTNAPDVLRLEWEEGSDATLSELGDNGIAVTGDFADEQDVGVGDTVTFETPRGREVELRVAGIYDPGAGVIGGVLVSNEVLQRDFEAKDIAFALIGGAPGADPGEIKRGEQAALASFPTAKPQTIEDFKDEQNKQVDTLVGLVYALLSLSVIVALLGIVNTLALSVHERTHELGLLRAVGMSRRQVRRMVRAESVITAAIGAVLGIVLGIAFAAIVSRPLAADGFVLTIPVGTLIAVTVLAAIAGVLAAIPPARRAARVDVLRAVTTE